MAGVSLLWGTVGLGSMGRVGGIWSTLVMGLVVIGLGVAGAWGLWRARMMRPATAAERADSAGTGRWFGRIFTAQGLAVAVCEVQHRPELRTSHRANRRLALFFLSAGVSGGGTLLLLDGCPQLSNCVRDSDYRRVGCLSHSGPVCLGGDRHVAGGVERGLLPGRRDC